MSQNVQNRSTFPAWILLSMFLLTGCQPQTTIEVGFKPIIVPVRISINSHGEVSASASYEWVTPIGVFDIGGGVSVNTIRNNYSSQVLIVRVDDEATVYKLEEGAEFDITFDDSNTLYKKVALHKESGGDFILELERVVSAANDSQSQGISSSSSGSSSNSCPGAPAQRLQVGDNAYVCTAVDTVALREGPGKNYAIIKRLVPGADLKVIGGPSCANNWSFWEVRTESGYTGWMSEGGDSKDTYFLCPK